MLSLDDAQNIDKSFKDKLPIEDRSWLGIGRHLGQIVKKATKGRESIEELRLQNTTIPANYVLDYINGIASFGCFFRTLQSYFEIGKEEIFGRSSFIFPINIFK